MKTSLACLIPAAALLLSGCAGMTPAVKQAAAPVEPPVEQAAPLPGCLNRAQAIQDLADRYQEHPTVRALQSDGAVLEFLTSPDATFTVLETRAMGRRTCTRMISAGTSWQRLEIVGLSL